MKPTRHQAKLKGPSRYDSPPGRVRIAVWVTPKLEADVQMAAIRSRVSVSAYVAGLLMKHVEDVES